jgi:serine/threonine-protein kinase
MYEMATGHLPFNHENPEKVTKMQIEQSPRRPRSVNPAIPKGLEQIILHAMEKHAFMRYPDASHMLAAVRTLLEDEEIVFDYGNELPNPNRRYENQVNEGVSGKVFAAAGVAVAFIAAFIITVILAASAPMMSNSSAVIMPDLVGDTWLGAPEAGLGGDFCRVKIEYVVDEGLPENTVISQSVSAGTRGVGSENDPFTVEIKVSRKSERLKMGDYLLFSEGDAVRRLSDLGYDVHIEYVKGAEIERGRVISTYPAAGYETVIGQRITITVGK